MAASSVVPEYVLPEEDLIKKKVYFCRVPLENGGYYPPHPEGCSGCCCEGGEGTHELTIMSDEPFGEFVKVKTPFSEFVVKLSDHKVYKGNIFTVFGSSTGISHRLVYSEENKTVQYLFYVQKFCCVPDFSCVNISTGFYTERYEELLESFGIRLYPVTMKTRFEDSRMCPIGDSLKLDDLDDVDWVDSTGYIVTSMTKLDGVHPITPEPNVNVFNDIFFTCDELLTFPAKEVVYE